jgi:hypothetical protein
MAGAISFLSKKYSHKAEYKNMNSSVENIKIRKKFIPVPLFHRPHHESLTPYK